MGGPLRQGSHLRHLKYGALLAVAIMVHRQTLLAVPADFPAEPSPLRPVRPIRSISAKAAPAEAPRVQAAEAIPRSTAQTLLRQHLAAVLPVAYRPPCLYRVPVEGLDPGR